MTYDVELRRVDTRQLAVVVFQCPMSEIGARIGAAFGTVAGYLARTGRGPSGPAIGYYRTFGDTVDGAAGFEVSEPISAYGDVMPFTLPACEVAVTTHVGPYTDLPKAYEAMRDFATAHGRSLDDTSPMWEHYHSGPQVPPEQIRTEIFWPLVPAGD